MGDSNQAGSGDPALVDLEKQDYNLKSDSPLRGKAINLSELYKLDFYGRPLPKTGNWDIGAIQYNTKKPTEALQPKRWRPYPWEYRKGRYRKFSEYI